MKKHFYLFGAIALPLLMTGCSNELLDVENDGQELVDGKTVKLDKNFRLFANRVSDNASEQTRGEWINPSGGTRFYWMPEGVVTSQTTSQGNHSKEAFDVSLPEYGAEGVNLVFDEVGLCWLGNGEVGENIFTNYKFIHDGWLENGADNMADQIVDCDDVTGEYLKNWNWVKYVKDADTYGTSAADYAAEGKSMHINPNVANRVTGKFNNGVAINAYDPGNWHVAAKQISTVNLSKGTFRTDNKSIFTGKYLAYYPYDGSMVEQGRLQAKTFTKQTAPVNYVDRMLDAGKYTFMTGYMSNEIKGGTVASALTMHPISGLMSIKQYASIMDNAEIQHLVVMSAGKNITATMGLKADAIKAADGKATAVEGAVNTSTQKIMVDFTDKDGEIATLQYDADVINPYNRIIIPVLPSTISDLDLMWIDKNGKAKITSKTLNVTIPVGTAESVDLINVAHTYQNYVAWDVESLKNALANAANDSSNKNIIVIDKIVLEEDITIPEGVTVTGWWRGAKVGEIVVAASNVANNPNVLTAQKGSTIDLDLTIEGVGCCEKIAGVLDAQGITYKAKNTLTNNGLVQFTSSTTPGDLRTNNIYGNVENTPLKYVAGETVEPSTGMVYQLSFETQDFTAYDYAQNLNTDDTYSFNGSVIAISTQASVNIYGKLNNNTSSDKTNAVRKDALIVLEKRNAVVYPSNNQDARLVIQPNGAVDNFATMHNQGTVANNSGNKKALRNEVHATFINMIGGQLNGYKMEKEANSNFIAQVDNSKDSRYATALNEHLANIIEILPLNSKYASDKAANWYPMDGVNNEDLKYVISADNVCLIGKKDAGTTAIDATIGAIEVKDAVQDFKINTVGTTAVSGVTPVNLNVKVTEYNNTHTETSEVLTNPIYGTNLPAVYVGEPNTANKPSFTAATSQVAGVKLNVEGDVEFNGIEYIGKDGTNLPVLYVKGDFNVKKNTCTFEPQIVKGTIDGNMNIANNATVNFLSDVKLKVGVGPDGNDGNIDNKGTFNIDTNVIIKSPAIIYCKSYNLEGGEWLNGGRPTPFTSGGVIPSDYNW